MRHRSGRACAVYASGLPEGSAPSAYLFLYKRYSVRQLSRTLQVMSVEKYIE